MIIFLYKMTAKDGVMITQPFQDGNFKFCAGGNHHLSTDFDGLP